MGVLIVLTLLVVAGLLLLFNLIAGNMAPRKGKRAAEVKRLRADMDQWMDNLVSLDREELELLSLTQQKQVLRKGPRTEAKGVFTTIYHEPVAAYSYRKYIGKKNNDVLLARTADHEFVFWTVNGETTLDIDGQEVGTLRPDGTLLGKRTGKELARVAQEPQQQQYLPVQVGNREIGSLALRTTDPKGLPNRAFEFLQQDINDKEELLFLSLVLHQLVQQTVR